VFVRGWIILASLALVPGLTRAFSQETPAHGTVQSVASGVGELYFRSAQDLYRAGKPAESTSLLRIALEYNPTNSDPHFLLGKILSRNQSTGAEAITQLETALNLDEFHSYLASDCAIELGNLYLQTKRYDRGVALLDRYTGRTYVDAARYRQTPDRSLISGDGAEGARRNGQARALLVRGLELFPESAPLMHARMLLDPVPSLGTTSWLEQHGSDNPEYLSFLLDYIRRLTDGALRKQMLDLYFSHGGNAAEAWAFAAGQDKTDSEALKGLIDAGGLPPGTTPGSGIDSASASAVQLLAARLTDPAAKKTLTGMVSGFSGNLGVDENGDGFFEQKLTYAHGVLVRWQQDENQDGIPERSARFSDGKIISLSTETDTGTMRIQYEQYPRVRSVEFASSTMKGTAGDRVFYSVRPGRLEVPFFSKGYVLPAGGAGVLDHISVGDFQQTVDEEQVMKISSQVVAWSGGADSVSRVFFLRDGLPYLMARSNPRSGTVDEVVEYRDGEPIAGIRDLNGNGYFDESEFYAQGKVSYLAVDENQDGVPDFFQQITPQKSLAWDLNGDGRVDIKDMIIGAENVRRLFSTELNGRLNGSVDIKRFIPSSAEKGSAAQ
jgi:tetratricopeptide (TPR) repeat protein